MNKDSLFFILFFAVAYGLPLVVLWWRLFEGLIQ